MVDYTMEIWQEHEQASGRAGTKEEAEKLFDEKRGEVYNKINVFTEHTQGMWDKLEQAKAEREERRQIMQQWRGEREAEGLEDNDPDATPMPNLPPYTVDYSVAGMGGLERVLEWYYFAKITYDCGDYAKAKWMLGEYFGVIAGGKSEEEKNQKNDKNDNKTCYGITSINQEVHYALWGNLACWIVDSDGFEYAGAEEAFRAVKFAIDVRGGSSSSDPKAPMQHRGLERENALTSLEALQQRTWLLHWSLFVFLRKEGGSDSMEQFIDLCLTEKYMQAIQTNAPHILRYLCTCVIMNKQKRGALQALVKIIQHRHCDYTDPIIDFVNCLYVKFDFEAAQEKLGTCGVVLANDYFLGPHAGAFLEEARVFIFENYCRIHRRIDIAVLGEKLAMDPQQAEKWIVDLIRNAFLDARIDAEANCVVMGSPRNSVYQQVIQKTKDLTAKTDALTKTLGHHMSAIKAEKQKAERAKREAEY